jgi:hypothetical protein
VIATIWERLPYLLTDPVELLAWFTVYLAVAIAVVTLVIVWLR